MRGVPFILLGENTIHQLPKLDLIALGVHNMHELAVLINFDLIHHLHAFLFQHFNEPLQILHAVVDIVLSIFKTANQRQ